MAELDKRLEEAISLYEKAAALEPEEAQYHLAAGNVLFGQRYLDEALEAYRRCAALQPGCTDMQVNYAALLIETNRREEARLELERLQALGTAVWQVPFNLGGIYREYSRIEESIACYRRCLEIVPDHAASRSNLLLIMNYGASYSAAEIYAEHRRFGEHVARRYVVPSVDAAWPRRLKVGYVSPDLRGHVVTFFLEPLLANHDHAAFEVYCYHTHPEKDGVTERLRGYADHWRDCEELSFEELAAQIREDGIDILVDLAGHTAENRLLAFAMKPAPVQATFLGYPHCTGLGTIDYHITDAFADPPGEADALTVERKARLPGSYFCYRPAPAPEVGPLPARSGGAVTFGCFNNFPKVSSLFVDAAARILAAVPGSRLLVKARPLSVPSVADGLRARFAEKGVDPQRLVILGWKGGYRDHLGIYNDVDIALDTFPYNGATTTCEAMWMGVPVVSLAWDRHAGRMGSSLLNAVGLGDLVARTADEYVSKAVHLASDLDRLSGLRSGLRERFRASPLMDEPGFARRFEALYRDMWQQYRRPRAERPVSEASVEQSLARARRCSASGQLAEADAAVRQALELQPANREALQLLCQVSFDAGAPGAAIDPLLRALALDDRVADFHYMLGASFQEQGKLDDAIVSLRRALELDPALAKAHNNLGCILEGAGRLPEAMASFREAARLDPALAHAHYNLANACKQSGDVPQAMENFERALALEPTQAEWRSNLANLQYGQWEIDAAIANLRRALDDDPRYQHAHVNLAAALLAVGDVAGALEHFATAQRLEPDLATESWMLLARHYLEQDDPVARFEAHRAWAARHASGVPRLSRHAARRSRGTRRRLNVGYVSPDFRRHPVAHFIEPVLASHDREAVQVFCYSSGGVVDETTRRLSGLCDFWRDVSPLDDHVASERVRADGIDVLVDLAGHTGGGRLLLFARKPAPVQVTWIGYPDTTGLEAMDYRLTDAIADPVGKSDAFHTEALVRLPGSFLCYGPPQDGPDVAPLPALRAGTVTFGCFNNLPKITPGMVDVWADLLRACPGSRLLLKSYGLMADAAHERVRGLFEKRGVAADRLLIRRPEEAFRRHLECYHEVDIALDVFPYNGTTTTCEALWMGVPVVSLSGDSHVSRVGASLLTAAGLPQLVARTSQQYVAAARDLAGNLPELAALRQALRERLRGSPLLDAGRFARGLEAEYRRMTELALGAPALAAGPER